MTQRAGTVEVLVRAEMSRFRRDMRAGEREANRFHNSAQRGAKGTTRAMGMLTASTNLAAAAMLRLKGNVLLLTAAFTTLAAVMGTRSFAQFEATMNNVRAVSGAVGSDFELLNQRATKLGATTKFSASQVAEGMSFMAMAGLRVNEIYGGVEQVLTLAAAGNLELGQSADIVTNIMTSLGLQTEELGRAVDVLTKTFTSSNTTLIDLGGAFKFVAPFAKAAGFEFEEVAAALGLLGNAGMQGFIAGTALRGIIVRLQKPTKEAQKQMKALGINVLDSSGRLKSLTEIMRAFEPHAKNVSLLAEVFGQRAGPGMANLLGQGSAALQTYTQDLKNSGGTAERIANIQMEGLKGAFIELKSAAEGFAIAVGESGVGRALESLVDGLTRATRAAESLIRAMQGINTQSLESLNKTLADQRKELAELDRLLAKERDPDSFWSFLSDPRENERRRQALLEEMAHTREMIRLQQQLREMPGAEKRKAPTVADEEAFAPSVDAEADMRVSKRKAALQSLIQLEDEYLRISNKNAELIRNQHDRELAKFKELLDAKLISEEEYMKARAMLNEVMQQKLDQLQTKEKQFAQDIGQAITSNLESAFRSFLETGKLDFKKLAQSIMADITMIILRMMVLKPLMQSITGGLGGGGGLLGGGGGLGGLLGGLFHEGGEVRRGGPSREVPAATFLGAPRLHKGGQIIKHNEVPAILQVGEMVTSKADAKNMMQGENRPVQVVMHINTPDANSFRRSQDQILRRTHLAMNRVNRRNG